MWSPRDSGHISYVLSRIIFGSKLWDLHSLKHMKIIPERNLLMTENRNMNTYENLGLIKMKKNHMSVIVE